MSERDYKQILLDMIDRLVDGACTVDEFRTAYYWFWLDEVPRGELSEDDEEIFSEIQEKLDWTTDSPTTEEREYGWLSEVDYVDLVRLRLIGFKR